MGLNLSVTVLKMVSAGVMFILTLSSTYLCLKALLKANCPPHLTWISHLNILFETFPIFSEVCCISQCLAHD